MASGRKIKHVLIVDDESAISGAIALLLGQAGYATSVAGTASTAISLLSLEPDLVILDIRLPDMDGFTVCQVIRQLPRYVPIIMVTAKDEPSDRIAGLALGADIYVTKPFEPGGLVAQVRALLRLIDRNLGTSSEGPIDCGPIRLWVGEHRVECNGKTVDLTPKEFELLHLFMKHIGHAFGRETLLREVWGYDYAGDTRTVDVHIQRLRHKIENRPADPRHLVTIRGFGYRLVGSDE